MRVLDVFCGAGGMSTGLEQAGWKTVCAVDIHEPELRTFHAAHPTAQPLLLDLIGSQAARDTVVNAAKLLGVNAVVGGPPCQGFSGAGDNEGENDPRNGFPAFIEIVRRLNPDVFLFENVPGLVSQHKEYFDSVLKELGNISNYQLTSFQLNSADYGVPQARKRIFCIGKNWGPFITPPPPTHSNKDDGLPNWIGWGTVTDWSLPCDQPATQIVQKHVKKWLEKNHPDQLSFQLVQQLGSKTTGEACRVKNLNQPSPTVLAGGQTGGRADLVVVRCDGADAHPDGAPVFTPDRPAPTQSFNPGCVLVSGKQNSETFSPPVRKPDCPSATLAPHHNDKLLVNLDPERVVLTSASKFNSPKYADQPSQTVLSGGPHGGYNYHIVSIETLMQRHLTMTEIAALQGFPPNYPFHGNKTTVRRQIGNAVCAPVARAIAEEISRVCDHVNHCAEMS